MLGHYQILTGSGHGCKAWIGRSRNSYSMEMNLIEETTDHDETLESMPLGSIYLEFDSVLEEISHNNWRKNYPIWQSPRSVVQKQIGDCYEMTTEYLLTILQPYPGDEFYGERQRSCPPDRCFQVRHLRSHNDFKIIDRLTDFEITINKSWLDNLKFNLGHWYAKRQARALGLNDSMKNKFLACMEEPVAVRGRSTSSDVSSDISLSPLYIPPHRCQPKMECTRGSDTGVRWSCDVTFLSLFHHSPSFSSFHYFFIILLFPLRFLVYRHASHLSRALSFYFRIPW